MDGHLIESACESAMLNDCTWGKDDCSLWACDIVNKISGLDLAKVFRGKYKSANGAARALKKFAGGGLVEAAIKIAVINSLKPASFPWRGDLIGIVAGDRGPTLAIFHKGQWIARSEKGVEALPPRYGVIAWEVPSCRR